MKKNNQVFIAIFFFVILLSSCVTSGWNREYNYEQKIKESIVGYVKVEQVYIQPLFIGFTSSMKRQQMKNKLLKEAKKKYGEEVELTNIVYSSSWNPCSLLFYFGMAGFVENASAVADVYSVTKINEYQKQKTIAENNRNGIEEIKKEIKKRVEAKKENEYENKIIEQTENLENDRLVAKSCGSPIGITHYCTTSPNSAGGVGCKIRVFNATDKIIKYIDFTVTPYNRVFDKACSEIDGKSEKVIQIVNFISPSDSYETEWENVWYNNTILYMQIDKIKVTFTDNSTENISSEIIKKISDLKYDNSKIEKISKYVNPVELYNNEHIKFFLTSISGSYYFNCETDEKLKNVKYTFECEPMEVNGNLENKISNSFGETCLVYSETYDEYTQDISKFKSDLLYLVKEVNITYENEDNLEKTITVNNDRLEEIKDFVCETDMARELR